MYPVVYPGCIGWYIAQGVHLPIYRVVYSLVCLPYSVGIAWYASHTSVGITWYTLPYPGITWYTLPYPGIYHLLHLYHPGLYHPLHLYHPVLYLRFRRNLCAKRPPFSPENVRNLCAETLLFSLILWDNEAQRASYSPRS